MRVIRLGLVRAAVVVPVVAALFTVAETPFQTALVAMAVFLYAEMAMHLRELWLAMKEDEPTTPIHASVDFAHHIACGIAELVAVYQLARLVLVASFT